MKALLITAVLISAFSSALIAGEAKKKLVEYQCGLIREDKTMSGLIYNIKINGRDSDIRRIHGMGVGPHVRNANEFRYSAHAGEFLIPDRRNLDIGVERIPAFILEHYQNADDSWGIAVEAKKKGIYKGKYLGIKKSKDANGEIVEQQIFCQDKE